MSTESRPPALPIFTKSPTLRTGQSPGTTTGPGQPQARTDRKSSEFVPKVSVVEPCFITIRCHRATDGEDGMVFGRIARKPWRHQSARAGGAPASNATGRRRGRHAAGLLERPQRDVTGGRPPPALGSP